MNHERFAIVNEMDELIHLALSRLPQRISAERILPLGGESGFGQLCLQVGQQQQTFNIIAKRVHRKESLQSLRTGNNEQVLICDPLSNFLAEQCEVLGVNFIDAAGNARIMTPALSLWIQGNEAPISTTALETKLSVGTMKLIFALLAEPSLFAESYRRIAQRANLSLGMVGKGMKYLTEQGYVRKSGSKNRLVCESELIQLWLSHYPTTLRPKLGGVKLIAPDDWRAVDLAPGDVWGGEVAADQLTDYLVPEHLQLFTQLPIQQRIGQLRLRPQSDGLFWLVPAFWGAELIITPRAQALLAEAELRASQISRNIELVEMLHERYLSA